MVNSADSFRQATSVSSDNRHYDNVNDAANSPYVQLSTVSNDTPTYARLNSTAGQWMSQK